MASVSHNSIGAVNSQKEFLLPLLRESREMFLGSFAGVSEEQARLRPGENRWSVLDTVEHLTAAETVMVKIVTTQRRQRAAGDVAALSRSAPRVRKSPASRLA